MDHALCGRLRLASSQGQGVQGPSRCGVCEHFIPADGWILGHGGRSAFYLSVHQPLDRLPLLGCYKAATNTRVHVCVSLGWVPSSGLAGSDGIPMLNILRKFEAVFQSDYNILHSHQQSSGPWSWEVFLPTCIFFSFFQQCSQFSKYKFWISFVKLFRLQRIPHEARKEKRETSPSPNAPHS